MSKIIVSYRRSDSQAVAGRIVDRLIANFGADAVFMDVDNIPFGIDFRDHVQSVLSHASVLIAIVGPDWLGADADNHRRIDDEDDPVRVELETALRQKLMVIPVLVNNASMPKASVLPDAVRGFSFLNAAPVDVGRDFRPHVDRLIRSIETILDTKSGGGEHSRADLFAAARGEATAATSSSHSRSGSMVIVAAAALLVLGGAAVWLFGPWGLRGTPGASLQTAADPPPAVSASTTAPPASSAISPAPPVEPPADDIRWDLLRGTTDVGLLLRFIEQYPDSKHRVDAERRIAGLATASPPSVAAVPPAPVLTPVVPDPNDESDWDAAQKANSYEAYQAYAKHHPQGRHLADARKAAITNALGAEPPIGRVPTGETVLVDDRICEANQIKAITGGDVTRGISRTKKCISRDQPF